MFHNISKQVVSLLLTVILSLSSILSYQVHAQETYTLTGSVTYFDVGQTPEVKLYETDLDGNRKLVEYLSYNITENGVGGYNYTITFEYSTSGGALTVTAECGKYSFITESVSCNHDSKSCTAPDITPTPRTFSGIVYKPNGKKWGAGFNIVATLDGSEFVKITNDESIYSFWAYDSQEVTINPDSLYDGYQFKFIDESGIAKDTSYSANAPLGKDFFVNIESQGTRSISGQLDGSGVVNQCIVGATIKAEHTEAVQGNAVTDSKGNFTIYNLEPVDGYTLKVTYPNTNACETIIINDINLISGDRKDLKISLAGTSSITGKVMANMRLVTPQLIGSNYINQYGPNNPTTPLAYYLLANYTTNRGFVYTTTVDWLSGVYKIDKVPKFLSSGKSGTLEISRVGGTAAFGYESGYDSSQNCTLNGYYLKSKCDLVDVGSVQEVRQDFLLTPSRLLSGTIIGQSVTPIQRGAMITFGEGLMWQSPGVLNNAGTAATNFAGSTATTFTLLAQPRIYYLQPTETGGLITGFAAAGMNRRLANLTAANSTGNAFTVNLRTGTISGCLETEYGEAPVIPSATASLRLRPDTVPSGTANTFAGTITATNPNCNGFPSYTIPNVPYGVVGTFEFDNHNVIGNNRRIADPFNGSISNQKLIVQGDRTIYGKVYSAFNQSAGMLNPAVNFDLKNNINISALSGTFAPYIKSYEDLKEFEVPNLERQNYTVSYIGNIDGFDITNSAFNTTPVTANLIANSMVDIPFLAYHKPIDMLVNPGANLGSDGYMHDTGPILISWAPPEANPKDPIKSYELQVGNIARTAFTDTNPAVINVPHNPAINEIQTTFSNILPGQVYWYRIRPVFEYDKGPWSSATANPADRLTSTGFSPTPGFGWRYFTTPPNLSAPANNANIGAATQVTLTWAAMANTASLTPAPLIAYRVDHKNLSDSTYTSICVNTTSRTVTGLISGTYSWRVQAFRYSGTFNAGFCNNGSCTSGSCSDSNKFTEVSPQRTFSKP